MASSRGHYANKFLQASIIATATLGQPLGLHPANAQVGTIVGTASAGFLIDQLSGRIGEMIAQAERTGDFLLAQALRNMLQLLDSMKAMGDGFLNKTFDGLDAQQKQLFTNIDALLADTSRTSDEVLGKSIAIVDQAYQILNDIPLVGKNRYVILRYGPSTIVWDENREITLTITGLNVAPGKPVLKLKGQDVKPSSVAQQTATFQIPTDLVRQPFDDYSVVSADVELRDVGWFWDTTYTYPIKLTFAPRIFGSAKSVQMVAPATSVERSQVYRRDSSFEARDNTVRITQTPVGGGEWRIDPGSVSFKKTSGIASDPLYLDGPPTPTGFTMAMYCKQYYRDLRTRPGYGTGWWEWSEIKVTTANATSSLPGERYIRLGQTTAWTLPVSPVSVSGMFVDFRGNSFYFGDKSSSSPLVRIERVNNRLIIEPRFKQVSEPRTSGPRYAPTTREMFEEIRRQQLRYFDQFIVEFEKALASAESGKGEAIFNALPRPGGIGGENSFVVVKQRLSAVKAMSFEMKSPAIPTEVRDALEFRLSAMMNDSDFAARVVAILNSADGA